MSFERHSRTFSLLTLCSRLTGLLRDGVLSRIFGVGQVLDAFFFAFVIPNLFRRLFGEGALAAAFLPVYTRLDRGDPAAARRVAALLTGWMVVILGVVTLLSEVALALILAGGGESLAIELMMIMLPYMPLVCAVALMGAMLQVHGRFGPPAAAPVVLNLCLVGAAVGAPLLAGTVDEHAHVRWLAVSVVVAGVLQIGWMGVALRGRRTSEATAATAERTRQGLRDVVRHAGPMLLGLAVLQINTLLDGLIASYPTTVGPTIFGVPYPLEQGAMTAVSFAQRLYQFPLGVFGLAVATAIFPALARHADEPEAFASLLRRGLRQVVFIGLPASVGLMLVGRPLATVLFEGGEFSDTDSRQVSVILLGYGSAVWAYSMVHVLTRAFYARSNTRTPVRVAVAIVGLNLVLNLSLIWTPLRESALAWSTALCAVTQVGILHALIRPHVPGLVDRSVVMSWLRSVAITGVMAVAVVAVGMAVAGDGSWKSSALHLAAAVAAGGVVYAGAARLLRMPELRWALGATPS